VIDVLFVDPRVVVLTAAPVAILTVVAAASAEIDMAPVPLATVTAPLVPVITTPPEPDWTVVIDVVFVEPRVTVFTPAPVAKLTIFAVASVLTPTVPVPEFAVIAPFVAVTAIPPLPDLTAVVLVEFVLPKVAVFAPAPVATFTVVAAASVDIEIVPVPEFSVMMALVAVKVIPPDPEVRVTDVAPVALPKVFTLAPVVASVVAPAEVSVPVTARLVSDTDEANDSVSVLAEPVTTIWFAVPRTLKLPPPSGTSAPPESPVMEIIAPVEPAPARFHVAIPARILPRNQLVPDDVLAHCCPTGYPTSELFGSRKASIHGFCTAIPE